MATIAALLERSQIYTQLAKATADPYVKEQFRTHALALTRRAEIEREQKDAEMNEAATRDRAVRPPRDRPMLRWSVASRGPALWSQDFGDTDR
jgi:hypothetical protein